MVDGHATAADMVRVEHRSGAACRGHPNTTGTAQRQDMRRKPLQPGYAVMWEWDVRLVYSGTTPESSGQKTESSGGLCDSPGRRRGELRTGNGPKNGCVGARDLDVEVA